MLGRDGRGRAVTGGDGGFVLERLARGKFTVFATHPQYPQLAQRGVTAGSRDVRLRLQRGGSLAGIAVTAQGAPLTSFSLAISGGPAQQDGTLQVDDPRGAFRVERLAAGRYELIVFTEEGRVARLRDVVLAEGENKRDLRLVTDDRLTSPGGIPRSTSGRATMFALPD
jgi:hypothetical protein